MRFFYQIFVNSPNAAHESLLSTKEVKTSSNNNSNSPLYNVNDNSNNKKHQNNQQQQQYNGNNNIQATSNNIDNSVSNDKQSNDSNNKTVKINDNFDGKNARFSSVKTKTNKTATKVTISFKGKNDANDSNGNKADDSCYSFSDEKPLKVAFVSSKNAKGSKTYNILPANGTTSPNTNGSANANKPDFKSLRSNVSHYSASMASNDNKQRNDSNKLNNSGTVTPNDSKEYKSNSPKADTKNKNKTGTNDGKNNRNGNAILNSPNIVVSIPQNRRVSFSDDVFENMSLADLKTANKKSKNSNASKSNAFIDSKEEKKELPKLKIAISNLKATITSPKIKEKSDKSKKEPSPPYDPVLDYVGLKPISLANEPRSPEKRSDDHGHKKRKKGKHSKEPGSKRRKLHAEISSQEEESLKLKVKITGGKPSKHERKNSVISSDENSSSSSTTTGSDAKEIESPRPSPRSSPRPDRESKKQSKGKKTPPSASPVRIDDPNDDSSDVVFVSSTKEINTKPAKVVKFKEPIRQVLPQKSSSQAQTTKPTFAVPVGKPKVAKPQTMADMQAKGMFSPPHIPNYPTFHFPAPKVVSASPQLAPISSTKRAASSEAPHPDSPKQPKQDVPSRKNPIPNLIKATLPMKNNAIATKSNQAKEIFYNSTMSSTYTREIHTKKPLPMLLPPASVSVTEVSVEDSGNGNFTAESLSGRPALEIVRIPANVPTVDQQHVQVERMRQQQIATAQKPIRPMPSTIPLLKIKNAGNQMKANAMAEKARKEGEGSVVLDLSGRSSRSPSQSPSPPSMAINKQIATSSATLPRLVTVSSSNSQTMMLKSTPMSIASNQNKNFNTGMTRAFPKNMNSVPTSIATAVNNKSNNMRNIEARNSAAQRERLQSPPPLLSMVPSMMSANQARNLPIPKLNEIGKNRPNGPVRQQNASVRNVPNPSALAFRNQGNQPKSSKERCSPPTAVSVALTGSSTVSPKAQSPTLPAGNRTPIHSSATTTLANNQNDRGNTITSTTKTTALLFSSLTPISKLNKQQTLTSHDGTGHARINNNDITDAKSIAAKKNQLERVAQRLIMNSIVKNTATSLSS